MTTDRRPPARPDSTAGPDDTTGDTHDRHRPSTRWTRNCPPARLAALGLQHVLVMYAGAIAVPLIVGRALKLTPEQVALLISADLFACGIVTLIQSLGRDAVVRHQAAGDDGRDLRGRRPDGGVRQRDARRRRRARDLRRHHRRGHRLDAHRADRQQAAALLSAGGHRHHHRDHRHQPDARRRGLGDGRAGASWRRSTDVPKLVADGRQRQGRGRSAGAARARPIKLAGPDPDARQPELRRARRTWPSPAPCWSSSCCW